MTTESCNDKTMIMPEESKDLNLYACPTALIHDYYVTTSGRPSV